VVARALDADEARSRRVLRLAAVVTVACAAVVSAFLLRFSWLAGPAYAEGDDARYVAFCREVAETVPPGARIATHELGVLGWVTDRYMIDTAGIATPSLLVADQAAELARLRPDYVLLYGPTVAEIEGLPVRPLKQVRFRRVGGVYAVRGETTATLYAVESAAAAR
jgi:hypothetical protein